MYRGTPYLNRNIKQNQEKRSMEKHLNNLTQIRPRTGTIQYSQEVHINNKKGQMQKEARFTQIERENRILLEKISGIMGKEKSRNRGESQQKLNRSLNSQFRKRQLQNIEIENAKLLKRLQNRRANYETQKFKQSWRKQKYVIKNLSNYPFILNDRKRKRSSVSHLGNRDSRPNSIQLCRMRVIDGISFLVTIRLNQHRLQIIGDTKDKREIKVIQIDRSQAIEFIQQECGGKVQKIFDCLRFDKVDQVMYLVANEVDMNQIKKEQEPLRHKMKMKIKRQENPEFDISLDPDQLKSKTNERVPGEIPIHVTNGAESRKYWVELDQRKATQKMNQNGDEEFKNKQSREQKSQRNQHSRHSYQQFQEQPTKPQIGKPTQQKAVQNVKTNNKVEASINTYPRINKFTEQPVSKNQPQKLKQQSRANQPQHHRPLKIQQKQEKVKGKEEDNDSDGSAYEQQNFQAADQSNKQKNQGKQNKSQISRKRNHQNQEDKYDESQKNQQKNGQADIEKRSSKQEDHHQSQDQNQNQAEDEVGDYEEQENGQQQVEQQAIEGQRQPQTN